MSKSNIVFIRLTAEVQPLRVPDRIKAMAERAGLPEAAIARAVLLLGLCAAERDPAAITRAAAMARDGG